MSTRSKIKTIYPEKVAWGGWHTQKGDQVLVRVDQKYPKDVRPLVRYHELREHHYMHDQGLPYTEAHRLANEDERRRFGERAFQRELGCTRYVLARNRGNRNPEFDWKQRAHDLVAEYQTDIREILRHWKVSKVQIRYGGTPDIASVPGTEPPTLIIGREWVLAPTKAERLKRIIHEVAGHMAYGIRHGAEARRLGYFSKPERDVLSWRWFREWRASC